MRIALFVASFGALVAVGGCSKKASNADRGMAPADDNEWKGSGNLAPMPAGGGGGGANPHEMGGGQMGQAGPVDPNAKLPPGHPMVGGGGGSAAPDLPQLPPPDPNRKMDPAHHIKGTIVIDPKLKDKVKAGTPVFLVAKTLDASGQPMSPPLAVERLDWTDKDSIAFSLDESNAMIAGTELKGEVLVMAHYDTDGEARSKTSGDVTGQMKVTIPSDGVKIVLDTLVP